MKKLPGARSCPVRFSAASVSVLVESALSGENALEAQASRRRRERWRLSLERSKTPPWGRAADNPAGGWYGQRKGYRGRLALYVPPLLEGLGRVELEHLPRNNRVRAR